ncbi:MAG: hypothetical protein RML72_08745 [Bacteroidia bacterium]|nr:hypothetical protein [Bacteroidia bacterium]MDW8158942.1 hypothetical protein [Bacteroidia bacterium]
MRLQGRYVRITFSIILSTLLWYSLKLVNFYKATITVPLIYTNYPSHLKLTTPLPLALEVVVSGKGHELFLPYFGGWMYTTSIDLEPYYNSRVISSSQIIQLLAQQLPPSLKIESIKPQSIVLAFERKLIKKVPIIANISIIQQEGYLPVSKVKLVPDSVELIGTNNDLSSYRSWPTEYRRISTHSPETEIPLVEPTNFTINPRSVKIDFQVKRFTEYTCTTAIRIKNLPSSMRLRLFPEKVGIRYLLPVDHKQSIDPEDFIIEVDYLQARKYTNYLTPILRKVPKGVRGVRLNPPYIYFVIQEK